MGRLITVSVSASGGSQVIPLDVHMNGFNISIGVVPTSGTPLPTIQHTFQNPLVPGFVTANAVWFNHETLVSCSTTVDGNYSFPVHAIRAFTSIAGDYTIYILQAGLNN